MTQNELHYQRQSLNRYVTPLEYFPSNPLKLQNYQEEIDLQASECVLSSFSLTSDGIGYEIRLYNSCNKTRQGGVLKFKTQRTIAQLDLNGKVQKILASNVKNYDILNIGKGMIITLGIF